MGWIVKLAIKYKFLGKNEIEIKHRQETLRRNKNTFRRLGVNMRLIERNEGANRVLGSATKLFKTLAPTLGKWSHELSDILEQRERTRQNRGMEKKLPSNAPTSDWRAEGAM